MLEYSVAVALTPVLLKFDLHIFFEDIEIVFYLDKLGGECPHLLMLIGII